MRYRRGGKVVISVIPFLHSDIWSEFSLLVESLGSDEFEREIFELVARHTPSTLLFAIEIGESAGNRVLMTECGNLNLQGLARSLSVNYAQADYNYDSVFREHGLTEFPGVKLVVQHPNDRSRTYREKYIDVFGTVEEISFFERTSQNVVYFGFCSSMGRFNRHEINYIKRVSPLLASLLRKHSSLRHQATRSNLDSQDVRIKGITRVLRQKNAGLTPREAEVCARIAAGGRTAVIAMAMRITSNTVATHRKNAYFKLGICSQSELSSMFIGILV
ncbi:LuxR family transcriptional regulator [Pseudomonas fluorescens]|uniref:helix-turn-helix transcriptional regulator n=1 Tax=Pseudomonas fluorescens TaxID=294 RepID=UPI000F4A862F